MDYITENDKEKAYKVLEDIRQADNERCSHCNGEDCICCSIWIDRNSWEYEWDM